MTVPGHPEPGLLNDWYSARALVAAEWKPAILVALLDGTLTYSQLRQVVQECRVAEGWNPRHERMHQSTLTRALRQLAGDGLLVRDELPGAFPRSVRYTLTPAAREMVEAIRPLTIWVERHRDLVEHARRRRWELAHDDADDEPEDDLDSDDVATPI